MSKFNLADAAKAVLMNEDSKSAFDANIASKRAQSGTSGHAPHGEVGKDKLAGSVANTKEVGDIGTKVDQTTDSAPAATKGVPSATPPGATPPVGSEGAHHLDAKFNQQSQGRADLVSTSDNDQVEPTSYENIRDRVKAKLAQQTFHANPGATFQSYAEETESDDEVVSEEKEEKEEGHEDAAQDKKMIKAMMKKEKMKEEVQSDVDALLSGENLSEEFKQKATTIFESAVVARTQSLVEEIEEALYEEFELAVEEVKDELAAKLDDYLSYMAEEWMKENTLAIEKGLRAEIVEEFIGGLKNLFVEHYIDIPEEKVDVVEELTNKVEELEAEVNEQIQANVEMHKALNEHKKHEAIHAVCEGLTQTQVEKMKQLAESVDFTTDEEFADKLVTLRTSYFAQPVKAADSSALNEEVEIEEPQKETKVSSDPTIAAIASALSKSKTAV
jgi:hypothetical protein